jgi:hypothetical protein
MPEDESDRLVRAGKALLAEARIVSIQRWAATAGVAPGVIRATYLDDAVRRARLEAELGARCVEADGAWFLIG